MKITDILILIKNKAAQDVRVNSSYIGDVYEIWGTQNVNYSSVVVDYENSSEYYDYTDHNFVVYFGDLLNEKKSNIQRSISNGFDVLKQLLCDIDRISNDFDVVFPTQYEPFQQSFLSDLAGGYIRFSVRTKNNYDC